MRMEIPAILPATPPTMAPVCEVVCPPIGIGEAEFTEEPRELLLVEEELGLVVDAAVEGKA